MTERRLALTVLAALGGHITFVAVAALTTSAAGQRHPAHPAPNVEVTLFDDTGIEPSPRPQVADASATPAGALAHTDLGRRRDAPPRLSPPSSTGDATPSGLADSVAGSATDALPAGATGANPTEAPEKIDFGLDGSLFRAEILQGARRPKAARPQLVQDDWSAVAVRVAADQTAPREGSALLTLEWDANGELRDIVTSGHSSDASAWQKLVSGLRRTLSKRPKRSAERHGLRVVYLVKSELIVPHHQRSVLPSLEKHSSFEQRKDEQLPPAVTLNFGVKADSSIPAERAVSVTLTSSAIL